MTSPAQTIEQTVSRENGASRSVIGQERTHNDLASSLALHLRSRHCGHRVTWENLEFSDWTPGVNLHCRPDVFSIRPTLDVEQCRPWTHEVKVSRADFLGDVRSAKWRQYVQFSCRVFFAAPKGLISPIEIPTEAGLWEFDAGKEIGWMLVKPAKFCKGWSLPPRHLMKLILGRWGTYQSAMTAQQPAQSQSLVNHK